MLSQLPKFLKTQVLFLFLKDLTIKIVLDSLKRKDN